jgi:hypothetical protein
MGFNAMKATLVLAILACAYAACVPSGSTARLKGGQTGKRGACFEKGASGPEALTLAIRLRGNHDSGSDQRL